MGISQLMVFDWRSDLSNFMFAKNLSMKFKSGSLYRIHNCGNNNNQIFYSRENYLYFLEKVYRFIFPVCEILGYNLMPNNFDFLIYSDDKTIGTKRVGM